MYVRSGFLFLSMGVGTVIMKQFTSLISSKFDVNFNLVASFSSFPVISNVVSSP